MAAHSNRNLPPLWPWALALYDRPGATRALLTLQDDAGLDVCELLWGLWLLAHGRTPIAEIDALLAPVRHWQQCHTQPLRRLRRDLKARAIEQPWLEPMRTHIKKAELESERETLRQLEALGLSASSRSPGHAAIDTGLEPLTGQLAPRHQRLISSLRLESERMAPPS
ncbi:TIGR02444 family protein [Kushneria avicenniae]|uniref:TIGR02444 family protein n=1 Tax=Kushneria avicenniae TaxID=402385 RepID=A0A1I1JA03_9GAMM|nr:TIGR02444 family protein [Kushneria avicenniae]SFC44961.1 TIGR02444 family protein [Kushneria avicenniae]